MTNASSASLVPPPAPRLGSSIAAISSDGRCVVTGDGHALRIANGPMLAEGASAVGAAVLDHAIWVVTCDADHHALHRFDRDGSPLGAPVRLGALGADVAIATARKAGLALIEGACGVVVREQAGEVVVESLGARDRDRRVLLGGRGIFERRGRAVSPLRPLAAPPILLPPDLSSATLGAGGLVFDGAAALLEVVTRDGTYALVYDLRSGDVRTRIRLGGARLLAIAERAGMAVLGYSAHVAMLDLRAGRCVRERILPAAAIAGAIDAAGDRVVCVDADGRIVEMGKAMTDANGDAFNVDNLRSATPRTLVDDASRSSRSQVVQVESVPSGIPSGIPSAVPSVDEVSRSSRSQVVQVESVPSAKGSPAALRALGAPVRSPIEGLALAAYLDAMRRYVVALARTAIATAPAVAASVGIMPATSVTAEDVAVARAEEAAAAVAFGEWSERGTPHVELAAELGLSAMGAMVLVLAAAPQIWGELARTYGLCTADPARPLVDELLLAHLLEASPETRSAIGRELDEDSALVRSGAVAIGRGLRPYAAIAVHPAIARRLAGARPAGDVDAAVAPRPIADLVAPAAELGALVRALAAPATTPVRVVLRGRNGSGRRTIAASLAACAARRIGLVAVDANDLEAVRARLRDVALRGDLPCVTLEHAGDPAVTAKLRAILDAHPGPLFVRAPFGGDLPLAPGYAALALRPLTETERRECWRATLARHGLELAIADELAARFAVGPGAIERACAAAAATGATSETLVTILRQQRAARIESIASRVDQLAAWQDLVVPPEIDDALRELISRANHRRTVLESWGMERVASTARGLTAMFQGGPGTGKTLAAGAVARVLGYELWRVDLSKVVSKWVGETEKNLAAVFDAAEDGEIVLLFDEADSLFGRRTDVKSSNDRNANLETNYLLQRLDTFTGIAILTTNLVTAIDPAFRRRLSSSISFPFPDATDRERLWRAHLPASLPIAGELDLAALADRYQLSGGYIRNAALRAAYLAAADGRPLADDHLRRAVTLEYQRAGQLGDGRLE